MKGHISDYHGYKRKYEHFAPLQFGSIENVRKQIGKVLTDNERNDEESDEDIMEDNRDYEQAIQKYEKLAEIERSHTSGNKIHCPDRHENDTFGEILVIFSAPEIDDMFASPLSDKTINKLNVEALDVDESTLMSQPPIAFQFFDDEDCVLMNADKSGEIEKPKRKSRSAQIEFQKKVSIRMLNEMLYTLNFIENYNRKSKDGKVVTKVTKKTVTGDMKDIRKTGNGSVKETCKIKVNIENCRRKIKSGRRASSAIEDKPTIAAVTINTLNLLESYENLRKPFSSTRSVDGKWCITAMNEDVKSILDNDVSLNDFFRDDEIVSEEKSFARCIRGYSSKADQEKIERRNFEEQQKLRKHEFEYYRLRKKKKSPEEIEWKKLSSRPIYYVRDEGSLLSRTDACNFKPNCSICNPNLDDEHDKPAIFFPKFRLLEDSDHVDQNVDQGNFECPINVYSGLPLPSNRQNLTNSLKLMELSHTLDFIENYNNGMIVSKKRRLN